MVHLDHTPRSRRRPACRPEQGSAAVEYVGLTALGASFAAAIGAALDAAVGERVLTAIVERLVAAVAGMG